LHSCPKRKFFVFLASHFENPIHGASVMKAARLRIAVPLRFAFLQPAISSFEQDVTGKRPKPPRVPAATRFRVS
jgi:hypothetical protein